MAFEDRSRVGDITGSAFDFQEIILPAYNSMADADCLSGQASNVNGWDRVAGSYDKYIIRNALVELEISLDLTAGQDQNTYKSGFFVWLYHHTDQGGFTPPPWSASAAAKVGIIGSADRNSQINRMKADPNIKWVYFPRTMPDESMKTIKKHLKMLASIYRSDQSKRPAEINSATTYQAAVNAPPASPDAPVTKRNLMAGILMEDSDQNFTPNLELTMKFTKYCVLWDRDVSPLQ